MKKVDTYARTYWMNIETGELFTRKERDKILIDEYDFDDYTNALEVYEYFTPVVLHFNTQAADYRR